eukprot:10810295-Karenia_brevis.AAC.1
MTTGFERPRAVDCMIGELNQDSTQCLVGLDLQRLVDIKCDVIEGRMWYSATSPEGKNADK